MLRINGVARYVGKADASFHSGALLGMVPGCRGPLPRSVEPGLVYERAARSGRHLQCTV